MLLLAPGNKYARMREIIITIILLISKPTNTNPTTNMQVIKNM